ncbi:hypothetical protein [Cyanobium sp. LEGE 06113]|uniref:hypothetical protein n=1 Tax=Cyanobium sp. LEGE 06113 TaxID=1297573 RepID=UPI00187E3626|nr:hypothetical protein [Cyanobium sp. LEGE 06113]MBE9155188.1 hypothetical protein [Cyanobium sp. LEGE 06113]
MGASLTPFAPVNARISPRFPPAALASPPWLRNLSRAFKGHRLGRPGWYIEQHRDRLRVLSAELPPRPGEAPGAAKNRSLTLNTPPGPLNAAAALAEACSVFDNCMAGTWSWPDPAAPRDSDDPTRLQADHLERLVAQLRTALVGEQMGARTWQRTWEPYLGRLVAAAAVSPAGEDAALLSAYLRQWEPNSRARQMGYDRARRLWKEAAWPWSQDLTSMRGSGRAAANPAGVRGFSDGEIQQLRERIMASFRLSPGDLLAWDVLAAFGLRPQELIGLELKASGDAAPLAVVHRSKRSSKGTTRPRQVVAVSPRDWPPDCHHLLRRWWEHGLPEWSQRLASPGQHMTQQLRRLHMPADLTAYGLRHAYALRLGLDLGLHVREAAELMGHSPQVHLATYGRQLDGPALQAKVQQMVAARAVQ